MFINHDTHILLSSVFACTRSRFLYTCALWSKGRIHQIKMIFYLNKVFSIFWSIRNLATYLTLINSKLHISNFEHQTPWINDNQIIKIKIQSRISGRPTIGWEYFWPMFKIVGPLIFLNNLCLITPLTPLFWPM